MDDQQAAQVDTALLTTLILEKANQSRMSYRKIAKETDLAHTTIGRVVNGYPVSMRTLIKLSKWLGTDPSLFINNPEDTGKTSVSKLTALVGSDPGLGGALLDLAEQVERGNVKPQTAREIIRYIHWRIQEDQD